MDEFMCCFAAAIFVSLGAAVGHSCGGLAGQEAFVTQYKDKKYCLSEKVADREFKRCWRALEVEP